RVRAFADQLTPESVQLAYQICVQGRADLPLAPDEPTGFSMTLLRLLAFEPASRSTTPVGESPPVAKLAARGSTPRAVAAADLDATVRPLVVPQASAPPSVVAQARPAPASDTS